MPPHRSVTIPSGRTPSVKEVEKLSKYKDLEIRIGKTWRMKTSTIPVVIGALSLINKGLIPGDIKMIKCRKCFMLGTAHILYYLSLERHTCPRNTEYVSSRVENGEELRKHRIIIIITTTLTTQESLFCEPISQKCYSVVTYKLKKIVKTPI